MKKKNLSMQVLIETVKKLETEAYSEFVPNLGKNWNMKVDDFDKVASHHERDDDLDKELYNKLAPSAGLPSDEEPTKSMRKPSPEEDFIQSLQKVAEEMDFSGDTKTLAYDLADTQEDDAYDTTEMVGFVDAAADALAASLQQEMPSFHNLSPTEMEDKIKSELMSVLRDMDSTDLYDRS